MSDGVRNGGETAACGRICVSIAPGASITRAERRWGMRRARDQRAGERARKFRRAGFLLFFFAFLFFVVVSHRQRCRWSFFWCRCGQHVAVKHWWNYSWWMHVFKGVEKLSYRHSIANVVFNDRRSANRGRECCGGWVCCDLQIICDMQLCCLCRTCVEHCCVIWVPGRRVSCTIPDC